MKFEEPKVDGAEGGIERNKKIILAGIEHRLRDRGRKYLMDLSTHLQYLSFRFPAGTSIAQSWNEMIEMSKEGTQEGRTTITNREGLESSRRHVANNPDVAKESDVLDLPWIVNHDNPHAESIISIVELQEVIDKVLKE